MNRADKMLRALKISPGVWCSRTFLFAHADAYYLTNNAASELRARGFNVEHRRNGRGDFYRLAS